MTKENNPDTLAKDFAEKIIPLIPPSKLPTAEMNTKVGLVMTVLYEYSLQNGYGVATEYDPRATKKQHEVKLVPLVSGSCISGYGTTLVEAAMLACMAAYNRRKGSDDSAA